MSDFKPTLKVGEITTNNEITAIFKVGNMGGMRRSKTTNTLVIISDHTKGIYDDKWYGNELHYTGMGKIGDQVLFGNQNKTLAESATNGVVVHLFEVLVPSNYIYCGVAKLTGKPYQEKQNDDDGNLRNVWMFPLKVVSTDSIINKEDIDTYMSTTKKRIKKLTEEDLKIKANEMSSSNVSYRTVTTKTYIRDPYIAEYSKKRAKGICQLCGEKAPFNDAEGSPYLESHHLIWLADGGPDSIENTVALCPNCHKKMHIVNNQKDVKYLQQKVNV